MNRFIPLPSGKLLCHVCYGEFSKAQARFHILHCKKCNDERSETGIIIDGKRMSDEERLKERADNQ